MKPTAPHDPLDDLIAAALHGELTPEERTQFDARLSSDPAARAAYQKAQVMHDLLEKTHQNAQPDSDFERRMVSGVRRKLQTEQHKETAWESLLAIWGLLRKLSKRFRVVEVAVVLGILVILAGVALGPITSGIEKAKESEEARSRALANNEIADPASTYIPSTEQTYSSGKLAADAAQKSLAMAKADGSNRNVNELQQAMQMPDVTHSTRNALADSTRATFAMSASMVAKAAQDRSADYQDVNGLAEDKQKRTDDQLRLVASSHAVEKAKAAQIALAGIPATPAPVTEAASAPTAFATPDQAPVIDTRKLIRNAQLDLEVKSFQVAIDQITALTKAAGGYVDTSSSQKGGNGKLQGTVVVKVLPQNLDSFLFKLRDLGRLQNQSVSTDDVTKDYIDTQARLDNSRKMEAQLQDLLKRTNGKVSDLLQVERELARVRGEIEQMQGQLKLYDFQVQYATVTMNLKETDLNQTAAYLLKENDNFSLFATDVEGAFQAARKAADDFKAHILSADLNHNSGSDISATLVVSVPPDQIEPFLNQLRSLGRVANFTRETRRVPKDGGDTDQPADQTLTDKDKVIVNITIRSDDESRKQVAMTVVTAAVDEALDQAKTAALANSGEILNSSLQKTPQGQSTGQLSARVPGKNYHTLLDAFKALGRTASFSLQRDDNNGPGVNGDDAPVIITLALTDEEVPLQQTQMSILASNVDARAQQLKKEAASSGVQIKASNFEREPNGMETAQMVFRLPMSKYPAFIESLKKLGDVEVFTVNRVDRPDQSRTDDTAPAEISLNLHSRGNIVANDDSFSATLRRTFGEGASALFGSIRVIGVLVAFAVPWVFTLGFLAWVGRRIYIWRKK